MKFGRFHGFALAAFGLFLLLAQAYITMKHFGQPQTNVGASEGRADTDTAHSLFPFFGVIGGLSALVGGFLIFTQPKRTLAEEADMNRSTRVTPDSSASTQNPPNS